MANTAPIAVIHTPWSFIVNAAEMETLAGVPAVGDAYFLVEPSYTGCWSAPLSSDHSALEGQALADLSYENWISTDPAYVDLAQEILSNGGDIAYVLQSLQTVMAANTYYTVQQARLQVCIS